MRSRRYLLLSSYRRNCRCHFFSVTSFYINLFFILVQVIVVQTSKVPGTATNLMLSVHVLTCLVDLMKKQCIKCILYVVVSMSR